MLDLVTSLAGTPPAHEIIVIPPPGHEQRQSLLHQCIHVRIDVFAHEQRFPMDVQADEHDQTATHILLRLVPCLTPIGTVRAYSLEGGNEYKFGRLAVLKPFRQRGFGRDLLFALHQWVQEDAKRVGAVQSTRVVCHAQLPVVDFYVKYGYQPEGDELEEAGVRHQKMVAYLPL